MTIVTIVILAATIAIPSPAEGVATWYDDGPGLYGAAGPALRSEGWRGSKVEVCHADRCVVVRLTDWCACRDRPGGPTVIDLSPDAFRRLAPLSRGVVPVAVRPVSARGTDGADRSPRSDVVPMPLPLGGRCVEFVRRTEPTYHPYRMVPV